MEFSPERLPDPAAAALRSLRPSLNTPVVAIEGLPVGPASAAIALHDDGPGGADRPTVAVRSLRTGEAVFFAPRAPEGSATAAWSFEAALAFAEGMGFLFDEEALEAPEEAAEGIWREFVRGAGPSAAEARAGLPLTKFRRAAPPRPEPGESQGPEPGRG